jgi:hypothetical protein
MKKNILIYLMLIFATTLNTVSAQDSSSKKKWQFIIEPYLMFASMSGIVGLDSLPKANVDADASDVFGHLKFGAMLYFEAHEDKWAISSDISYMKLGQDVNSNAVINSGEAIAEQFSWELAGLRKLLPFLEVGVGARINSLKSSLDLNYKTLSGPKQKKWSLSEAWVDPIVIARTNFVFLKGLMFAQARADIGGFGLGSNLAWQLQGYVGIHISRTFTTSLGYRVISMEYENGSGSDYFLYDVDDFGPVLRFGINF